MKQEKHYKLPTIIPAFICAVGFMLIGNIYNGGVIPYLIGFVPLWFLLLNIIKE